MKKLLTPFPRSLFQLIDEPNRSHCERILEDNLELFEKAWGSSHNHQAWEGGYLSHVADTMEIARVLYPVMQALGPVPFSLSDAVLIMFLHDLEKPWKRESGFQSYLKIKSACHQFRLDLIEEHSIALTPYQLNALTYVEGEGAHYSSQRRVMNELAAFCHMCDVASARIWHSQSLLDPRI